MTTEQNIVTASVVPILAILEIAIILWPKKWSKVKPPLLPSKIRSFRDIELPRKPAWMFVVGIIGMFIWILCLAWLEPIGYDPLTANPEELKSVTILPGQYHTLVQEPIVLSQIEIQQVCDVIHQAHPLFVNHPGCVWDCTLHFQSANESATIDVENSGGEPNGVFFMWVSPNLKLNRGEFRCDKLASILESIAGKQKAAHQ
jgi:hypothetical protein